MAAINHAHSAASPPKPCSYIYHDDQHSRTRSLSPHRAQQKIYVLSADGSSLFLLDPTKPHNEEPPPYAPFHPPTSPPSTSPRHAELTENGSEAGPSTTRNRSSTGSHRIPFPPPHMSDSQIPEDSHTRHRANTMSALTRPPRRPTFQSSHSQTFPPARNRPSRSVMSTPGYRSTALPDEATPLMSQSADVEPGNGRGLWRSILCGELDVGDDGAWKRFWKPVGIGAYWKAALHLTLLNFPFALLIWPFLLVGTLVGTALLITLPIGAAIWWLTLFLSRSAARLETITQIHFHSPIPVEMLALAHHPIFHRIKDTSLPPSPSSAYPETDETPRTQWETRFVKCSYAMFLDHYSYSALSYFLLIKPLIVLFSTIAIVALFPVCFVLVFTLPMILRAIRRWGQWQAKIALENL